VFFSLDKRAVLQKKLLKKVCKLFVADVVDVLPDKAKFLTDIVEPIVALSSCGQRLVRYAFTFVGLYIYKCLLSQTNDLASLKQQLDIKRKNEIKLKQDDKATYEQLKAISQAYEIVKTACLVL
jgi:STAG domain